jgi:hypothetical protein
MVLEKLKVRVAVSPERHKSLLQLDDSLGHLVAQHTMRRQLGAQELPQTNLQVLITA